MAMKRAPTADDATGWRFHEWCRPWALAFAGIALLVPVCLGLPVRGDQWVFVVLGGGALGCLVGTGIAIVCRFRPQLRPVCERGVRGLLLFHLSWMLALLTALLLLAWHWIGDEAFAILFPLFTTVLLVAMLAIPFCKNYAKTIVHEKFSYRPSPPA